MIGLLARRPLCLLLVALLCPLALACGSDDSSGSILSRGATQAPPSPKAPTATLVLPRTPTPTPSPTPAPTATPLPTPIPPLQAGEAIVIGGELRTRKQPSSQADQAGVLSNYQRVQIASRVTGENWLVGSQTWAMSVPSWASEWFKLSDGSFIYGAFVFLLQPGEVSPLAPVPAGQEKWIDVNLSNQTARAMVGNTAVFTAPMSSGASPFDTPVGKFAVEPDGRIAVEKMTATQAGYEPSQAQYDVERVLYTQYFDQKGDALHLNYWRPHSVFGKQATSHGCVGLELHEAQYMWLFAAAGTRVEIHK